MIKCMSKMYKTNKCNEPELLAMSCKKFRAQVLQYLHLFDMIIKIPRNLYKDVPTPNGFRDFAFLLRMIDKMLDYEESEKW